MLSSFKPDPTQPVVKWFQSAHDGSLIAQREGEPSPIALGGVVPLGQLRGHRITS